MELKEINNTNRKQYKDFKEIKNELLNDFMEENQEQINNMNDEDFKDLKQEFINDWVDNKFIYDSDIINLLSTNIICLEDIDNLKNEIDTTTRQAILVALIEKLEEDILI